MTLEEAIALANDDGWIVTLSQQRGNWLCTLLRPAARNDDGIINDLATMGSSDPTVAVLSALVAAPDRTIPAGSSAIATNPMPDLLAALGIPATRSGPPLRR